MPNVDPETLKPGDRVGFQCPEFKIEIIAIVKSVEPALIGFGAHLEFEDHPHPHLFTEPLLRIPNYNHKDAQ